MLELNWKSDSIRGWGEKETNENLASFRKPNKSAQLGIEARIYCNTHTRCAAELFISELEVQDPWNCLVGK